MQLNTIMESCLYVDNLSAAESFYQQVLGLRCIQRDKSRHAFFQCGSQVLLLFLPEASSATSSEVPQHGSQGPGHLAFHVPGDELDDWQSHLEKHGVPLEQIINWPDGGQSLYFRDPSGNSLELVTAEVWTSTKNGSMKAS